MLSTSSASAARHAARRSSVLVACGGSCTPTLNFAMFENLLIAEFDPAPAVAQDDRRLAGEEPLDRRAHEVGPPAPRDAARRAVQELREIGAGGEHRGVEVELRRALCEPRADH